MHQSVLIVLLLIYSTLSYQTLPLSGGILQKQHIATLYLGTPPQRFDLQVDTGSGKIGVNCQGCTNCHNHPNPPFDPSRSSTLSTQTCVYLSVFRAVNQFFAKIVKMREH